MAELGPQPAESTHNMVILSSTLSREMIVKEVYIPRILTEVNLEVEVIYPMQKITRTCN